MNSNWDKFLEIGRKLAVPKDKLPTGNELKEYIINEYKAKEISIPNSRKLAMKLTVLVNFYPHTLANTGISLEDKFETARYICDDNYNMNFVSLVIPRNDNTEKFYNEIKLDPQSDEEMVIDIELSTGFIQLLNGGRSSLNEIIIWRGITKEDIEKCTIIFRDYVSAMRDIGIYRIKLD